MKAVYLIPRSSFVTELRSDTLWGLLMVAIRYVYSEEKLLSLLRKFIDNEPPFLVSSAMPFLINKNGKIIHYFPKVIFKPKPGDVNLKLRKKFKEIKFISQDDFESFINGLLDESEFVERLLKSNFDNDEDKTVLTHSIWIQTETTHNQIDLLSNTTGSKNGQGQLFLVTENFIYGGGLYFLLDGDDFTTVEPALRFLTHYGFGGDHSIGKGAFDFEIKDFELKLPPEANMFTTLSLYNPKPDELSHFLNRKDFVHYELKQRNGIIGAQFKTHSYRKKSYFTFVEGSTFPLIKKHNYYGRVLKTMDEPTAYSYCFAFAIPSKFKE